MLKQEAITTLQATANQLKHGYAHDIIRALIAQYDVEQPPPAGGVSTSFMSEQDCDSLFRTLVMDENMPSLDAGILFEAATALIK